MIFEVSNIKSKESMDQEILLYLKQEKFSNVIDIGGVKNPWAYAFVDTYVDQYYPTVDIYGDTNYPDTFWDSKFIVGDIDNENFKRELLHEVEKKGKYEFCICTQLLEHLCNPLDFLNFLPKIAKEGYISVPTKYTELQRGVSSIGSTGLTGTFRGMHTHKWVCTIRDKCLWLWPKFCWLEVMELGWENNPPNPTGQLGFKWKNNIPYHIVDDKEISSFSPIDVIEYYRNELEKGL